MYVIKIWQTLYWTWIAGEVLVLIITRTRRNSGEVQDRGSLLLLWPVIFFSIFFGTSYAATHGHTMVGGASWLIPFSLALLILGLVIRTTAILTLGKSFSVNVAIHAAQTVHKTGLFRFVRHPSYTGMLLIFFAIGLATRNWIALAIFVVPPVLALLYRIHVEESALLGAFGDDYANYSRSTKRLIPGLY